MFNYNMDAVDNTNLSIFDSSTHNAQYASLNTTYETEHWTLNAAVIYGKANEVATAGEQAYNHQRNKIFTAATSQSDDLGFEIDFSADYHWNADINIGFISGYHFVGDYYTMTNDSNIVLKAKDSFTLEARTSVSF